jgi:DNA-binding transcriptional ArsR family regulator
MTSALDMSEIGFLVGDPARANMLSALMDGRARTAGELASFAGVTAQTASLHLRRLTNANLLAVLSQGRHRYFRLASPIVGRMLESMTAVAAMQTPPRHRRSTPSDEALRAARMCYDHLAGRLAVDIADALIARDCLALDDDGGEITDAGFRLFEQLGISLAGFSKRRAFCRPCLDWTERRFHIGGAVGAALARHALDRNWVRRLADSRALTVTPTGQIELSRILTASPAEASQAA